MASNTKIGTPARDAACNAIVDLLDVGGTGTLKVYSGAPPTNPGDAASGTLLATLTFGATAFGASSTGTATANAITSDTSADASADAGYCRLLDNAGVVVLQGTAGESADTVDFVFDDKSIVAGGIVACSSLTITVPVQ